MTFHQFMYELRYLCQDTSWYPGNHNFSSIHTKYNGFGPFWWQRSYLNSCLKNIVQNIVKSIEISWRFLKNSLFLNFKKEFFIQYIIAVCRHASLGEGSPSCCCCSRLVWLEELQCQYLPPWSYYTLSSGLQEQHQLEPSSILASFWTVYPESPLQAAPDQFKFRPVTSVHVWVEALDIVLPLSESHYMIWLQVSIPSCQAKWFWMTRMAEWKKLYLGVYNHRGSCVCPSANCYPFEMIWQQRLFASKFSAY